MVNIFAIGDSHSGFNFNHIPEVLSKGIGAVTMFRVGRDKMEFKKQTIPGCMGIFCFGEIDVRVHLAEHCTEENEDKVIEKLAKDYIETIMLQWNNDVFPVIMGVTPACRSTDLTPSKGSNEQRARYCKKLNNYLRVFCAEKELNMLDIYDYYADSEGHLIFELSDKANHIWDTKYVEEVFYKFLQAKGIDKKECTLWEKMV